MLSSRNLDVLASGSRVARRDSRGVLDDIEIIEPELIDAGDGLRLFYRYRPMAHGIAAHRLKIRDRTKKLSELQVSR
jgi:hypothetical protein